MVCHMYFIQLQSNTMPKLGLNFYLFICKKSGMVIIFVLLASIQTYSLRTLKQKFHWRLHWSNPRKPVENPPSFCHPQAPEDSSRCTYSTFTYTEIPVFRRHLYKAEDTQTPLFQFPQGRSHHGHLLYTYPSHYWSKWQ